MVCPSSLFITVNACLLLQIDSVMQRTLGKYSKRLTTGKNEKVDSSHVTAMKFIEKKRLVLKVPIIFLKIMIFVNM